MVFDGLSDRRPTMTPAELAGHLHSEFEDLEADLTERAGKLVAEVEPDYDSSRLEPAVFGLWAFAAYWGLASSPVGVEVAREVADELVMAWTRARSDDADWQAANEQVVDLFNALGENHYAEVSEDELPAAKEVYHGHLFLTSVLGDEHEGRFDPDAALQIYRPTVELAGAMEGVGEEVQVAK